MMTVTKTGTGVVPPPELLDAAALEQMTGEQRDAVYERWEGVLIEVRNVSALSAPVGAGSTTPFAEDAFATPATPMPLTGLTVATLLDPATAPLYESVLVTLDNVNVTAIGSTPTA